MNRYNGYMGNHFRDLPLLVEGHDPHRDRKVLVKVIPGDFSIVGVTDGVDAWIAPLSVAPSALFDRVRAAMAAYREGKPLQAAETSVRRSLTLPSPEPATTIIRRR